MNQGKSLTVLISGRGSNLKSLIDHQGTYSVKMVISDRSDAKGLDFARSAGIACQAFDRSLFSSRKEQKTAIYDSIRSAESDFVFLAGFMQILDPDFVQEFYGKIVNIHPSLLPEFPGLDTHKRALEKSVPIHGCSVHFVDTGVDTGPLIVQASCEVLRDDTEESLAGRVLQLEHKIYPWVASALCGGEISLKERTVSLSEVAANDAQKQGFLLELSAVVNKRSPSGAADLADATNEKSTSC